MRGRKRNPGAILAPRLVASIRGACIVTAIVVLAVVLVGRRREGQGLERERAALLDEWGKQSSSLTVEDKGAVARFESWLPNFWGPYEGDLVATELRFPGALAAVVKRPAVYVRGAVEAFEKGTTEVRAASVKDAFLLCLLDAPPSRVEKALLGKVHAAYSDGATLEQRTSNVRRLEDADVGLRVLQPPWAERVRAARELKELSTLRRELEQAPLERGKEAARATLLIVALDEPGEGTGPSELDGERPHEIRVGIVDLASSRILLRARRHVDPTAWSATSRAQYASGLDACAVAVDLRDRL